MHWPAVVEEDVYDDVRVVRKGWLRVAFDADMKIQLYEFTVLACQMTLPREVKEKPLTWSQTPSQFS